MATAKAKGMQSRVNSTCKDPEAGRAEVWEQ